MGLVVSEKMDKTVVVAVQRLVAHRRYGKRLRLTKRFMAHDEQDRCHVGDKVAIIESRPLSKRKRWRVCDILTSASAPAGASTGEATGS